jgi:hypothetical protein
MFGQTCICIKWVARRGPTSSDHFVCMSKPCFFDSWTPHSIQSIRWGIAHVWPFLFCKTCQNVPNDNKHRPIRSHIDPIPTHVRSHVDSNTDASLKNMHISTMATSTVHEQLRTIGSDDEIETRHTAYSKRIRKRVRELWDNCEECTRRTKSGVWKHDHHVHMLQTECSEWVDGGRHPANQPTM